MRSRLVCSEIFCRIFSNGFKVGLRAKLGPVSVGFCLGGKLSYLCAARLQVEVAVSYYGVKIENYLEESDNIKCPMTLHFAGNDPRVPPMARAKIESKFVGINDVNIYLYPNAEHGFNRVGYPPYHEVSARLALERTLNLFQSNLFPQSK